MRTIGFKSSIFSTNVAAVLRLINGPVSRTSCWRFRKPLQLRSSSCHSAVSSGSKHRGTSGHTVSLRHFRVCSPTMGQTSSQMRDFPHTKLSNLTNEHLVRHFSSRPLQPFEPESIPLSEEERVTLVKAEYELFKAEGEVEVPSKLEDKQCEILAQQLDITQRKKYLRFLFFKEMYIIDRQRRKGEKEQQMLEKRQRVTEELKSEAGHLAYGLFRNTMFISFKAARINSFYAQRVFHAKSFGQPILFDFGFDAAMNQTEKGALAKQFSACIGRNRSSVEPYYFHICNFRKEEETVGETLKVIPNILNKDYPVDTHAEDCVDLFPREKLVYITPHCRDELLEYDHDAIYIIGGLVKFGVSEPLILAKTKQQKIRTQKLPIDRFLNWGTGKKSLPLNHTLGILLEVKRSGDWAKAFEKYINKNKLAPEEETGADVFMEKNRSKVWGRRRPKGLFHE